MTNQEKLQIIATKLRNELIMGYSPFYDFYFDENTTPRGFSRETVWEHIAKAIEDGYTKGNCPLWSLSYDDSRED